MACMSLLLSDKWGLVVSETPCQAHRHRCMGEGLCGAGLSYRFKGVSKLAKMELLRPIGSETAGDDGDGRRELGGFLVEHQEAKQAWWQLSSALEKRGKRRNWNWRVVLRALR